MILRDEVAVFSYQNEVISPGYVIRLINNQGLINMISTLPPLPQSAPTNLTCDPFSSESGEAAWRSAMLTCSLFAASLYTYWEPVKKGEDIQSISIYACKLKIMKKCIHLSVFS